jgi:hypothetical protein
MNRELFEWVAKIIDTCTNDFHFSAIDKLIELFYEVEKNESQKDELTFLREQKWNKIHGILK